MGDCLDLFVGFRIINPYLAFLKEGGNGIETIEGVEFKGSKIICKWGLKLNYNSKWGLNWQLRV